ncbi:MAG: ThiF family adenylyltransferase [Candidatus Berkelbacteria bacterium]|nr:MAG: ThiF family adenylyltransferase [Candidatus Berkelbacteria bacterium]QQG51588.1 MAG: ThiF family adenylyltransferase [Candidatus Berkelbacteria bacterium]
MEVNKAFLSRNLGLLSEKQYHELAGKTVLIAGCGIGSVIAVGVARTGFHHIVLADGDVVEESNLNRQEYSSDDLGQPKVEALARRLKKLNRRIHVKEIGSFLDSSNISAALEGIDVVVDAIDPLESPMAVVELHRQCKKMGLPVVYPVDIGWGGGIFIFTKDSKSLEEMLEITESERGNDSGLRDKFMAYYTGIIPEYLSPVLNDVIEGRLDNIPQPASAAYSTAALSVIAIKRLVLGLPVKKAPDFISFDPHILHLAGE